MAKNIGNWQLRCNDYSNVALSYSFQGINSELFRYSVLLVPAQMSPFCAISHLSIKVNYLLSWKLDHDWALRGCMILESKGAVLVFGGKHEGKMK